MIDLRDYREGKPQQRIERQKKLEGMLQDKEKL